MAQDPELLTIDDLHARWRGIISKATLARWRYGDNKVGPRFIRLYSSGPVLYRLEDVIEWEQRNSFNTNREPRQRGKE